MRWRAFRPGLFGLVLLALTASCQRAPSNAPPPDARRPVIRSEAELAAERTERIQSGEVVPTSGPAPASRPATSANLLAPTPLVPGPGAIEADILLVNDAVITLPEILYPLRERLAEAHKTHTPEGYIEAAQRMLRASVQQEVGALLIYKEAMSKLSDPQRETVKKAIDSELATRINRDFGGSSARFDNHLARHGLTREQYRTRLERDLVARQYTRERLLAQVSVPRYELIAYYREHPEKFSTQEARTLLMIEAPFEAFLPAGTTWAQAPANTRALAKVSAARHIRSAYAALADKPFEDVAREFSRGVHATEGGAWGEIGRPLQPPYDKPSALVFDMTEGQVSEPLEGESGWYIVKCGHITPARKSSFADAQDEIRQELLERKFDRLSADYMIRLAEGATLSSLDAFIKAGVRRSMDPKLADDDR